MSRAIVVTGLSLRDLRGNVHGVYQRLRVLTEGISRVVDEVTVFVIGARETAGKPDECEVQLARHWGLRANVIVGARASLPQARFWAVEQLLQASSYRRSEGFRGIDTPENRAILRRLLQPAAAVVVAHKLPMMEFVASAVPAAGPVLFDLDDVEHVAFARQAEQLVNRRDRFMGRAAVPVIRQAVKRSIARAGKTFVCSRHDRHLLESTCGACDGRIVVLPNTQEIRSAAPVSEESTLLFVGTFSWKPNQDAVEAFLGRCWKRIRASVPSARFLVVGKNPEKLPSFRAPPDGVEFLGFVDDLEAIYGRARVVVCPIVTGGGTRVKLVEAAAYGKPIVSTSIGAEGLDFENEVHAFIADDMEDFASLCIGLLGDDEACARLSAGAHAHARRNFSRPHAVGTVENAMRALLN